MYINKNKLIDSLLCYNNFKLPITKSHYITGKEIHLFSNFLCVENTLTNLTCNIQNICSNIKNNNYFYKK